MSSISTGHWLAYTLKQEETVALLLPLLAGKDLIPPNSAQTMSSPLTETLTALSISGHHPTRIYH
ncbi:hypothetical protein MtrunA17_Chr8g0376711 [Medicago truncatula]|uniref:Uncharacterized protein n=1 Tax=Medicago truncatula TaxID=3880 RepID=A0A396GPI3_MEDTR|nr:hypothetical protein MtrunA17_Chr8g0376711 [Medicago truncatula]